MHFDGATFDAARDEARLTSQLDRVRDLMADGRWWTLKQVAANLSASEASVSARLRDLRKPRFGAYQVERRYVGKGLWQYRVLPQVPTGQLELVDEKGESCLRH